MTSSIRSGIQDVSLKDGSHAGLILTRYLPKAGSGSEDAKASTFNAAIGAVGKKGTETIYKAALARWRESLKSLPIGTRLLTFGMLSRSLIVGLGGDNVTETGLTLHHTYGVPYLPGSAIKGLAAHFAHQVWGHVDETWKLKGKRHSVLFGSAEGDEAGGGLVDFSDGWIADTGDCLLKDVMTPHHGDYYMEPVESTAVPEPTDFDSPIPVPFLVVKGTFAIALSKRDSQLPDQWLDLAQELVVQSLLNWGIGGKTNADYGRLRCQNVEVINSRNDSSAVTSVKMEVTNQLKYAEVTLTRQMGSTWHVELLSSKGSGRLVGKLPKNPLRKKKIRVRIIRDTPNDDMEFEYAPE